MIKQNVFFLILSVIIVSFIVLIGVFLAEQLIIYAFISFFIALSIMGYGFYLKRKWNSQ